MKTGYKVSDVMTHVPVFIAPDCTLEKCAQEIRDNKVGTLLVKKNDELIGMISERDIVRDVVADASKFLKEKKNISNIPVKEIMSKDLITIDPNEDIFDALNRMKEFDIRHLPVLHEGKLVGLLTLKDILKIEPQLFEILVEKIKLREEARKPINKINDEEGICELCSEYTEELVLKDGSLVCKNCSKEI